MDKKLEGGYFPLWRKFFHHPFWEQKRVFSRAEAWLDILANTQYDREPKQRIVRGRMIVQNYGEAIMSTRYCGDRWSWHKTTVERFLKLLENMEMLSQKCVHSVNVLIITNFSTYDIRVDTGVDTGVDTSGPLAGHWCGQSKEGKEGKEHKNIKIDKSIFVEDSAEYKLSNLLFLKIRANSPNYKTPNFQLWASHIDKMIRIDKRIPEQIAMVIEWCQQDEFWMANILSTKKLREKYDQLAIKMNGSGQMKKYSDVTMRNIESFKNWAPPEKRQQNGR